MPNFSFKPNISCDQLLQPKENRNFARQIILLFWVLVAFFPGLAFGEEALKNLPKPAQAVIPAALSQRVPELDKHANLSKPEIEAIIKTLDDPAKRAEFIAQLQALAQVERQAETQLTEAIPDVARSITQSIVEEAVEMAQNLRDMGQEIWHFRDNLPRYQNYLLKYALDDVDAPLIRQRALYLAAMFLCGMGLGFLFRIAAKSNLWKSMPWSVSERPYLSRQSVLPTLREELFSAIGFTLGYTGLAFFLELDRALHAAVIALFGAAMAVRGLSIIIHGILSPEFTHNILSIRLGPRRIIMINNWLHLVIAVLIYGILGIGVLKLLGIPATIRLTAIHLIGFILLLLAYRALWQMRHFGRKHQRKVLASLSHMGEHVGAHMGAMGAFVEASLPFLHHSQERDLTPRINSPSLVKANQDRSDSGEAPAFVATIPRVNDTLFSRLFYALQKQWWLVTGFYLTIVFLGWAFDYHGAVTAFLQRSGMSLLIAWTTHWLMRAVDYYFARQGVLNLLAEREDNDSEFLARLRRYLPILRFVLRSGLIILCLILILELWKLDIIAWLLSGNVWLVLKQFMTISLVISGAIIFWELVSAWIEHALHDYENRDLIGERPKRARTLLPILRNALLVVLAIGGGVFVLGQIGVQTSTILAGAGFISIGLGFGAQTIIRDIITGLFIVMEDTISIGDVIEADSAKGTVEAITLRNISLRDKDGAVHTIPFNRVNRIANFSRDHSISRIVITISRDNDANKVFDIMNAIDHELRQTAPFDALILEPLIIEGVENFTEHGVTIQAAQKTLPARNVDVHRAFHLRLMSELERHHIAMPQQHVVIKQG